MPTYLYWGEDDFAIAQAIKEIHTTTVDPAWGSFNYHKITTDQPEAVTQALNQAMTPPFGMGKRLVWLADTSISQQCSQQTTSELERTLPIIPDTTILLLTSKHKPDARLKSTKLLQKYATIQEFSPIPPWKTEQIVTKVQQEARRYQINLDLEGAEFIAQAVGNDTRLLDNELQKLALVMTNSPRPLSLATIAALVTSNTTSSLQLAAACTKGKPEVVLELLADLIQKNEPALRIVATLTGQFRTWLLLKLAIEAGEKDERMLAQTAEVSNPKRIYFLRQEISHLSSRKLLQVLPILLELEASLKKGAEPIATLQNHLIRLCRECSS
jgi:DNA polymerase-3 subunit delta